MKTYLLLNPSTYEPVLLNLNRCHRFFMVICMNGIIRTIIKHCRGNKLKIATSVVKVEMKASSQDEDSTMVHLFWATQ